MVSLLSPCTSITSPTTLPPVPQVFFSFLASSFKPALSNPSPEIVITPFPLRPFVSRLTFAKPSEGVITSPLSCSFEVL